VRSRCGGRKPGVLMPSHGACTFPSRRAHQAKTKSNRARRKVENRTRKYQAQVMKLEALYNAMEDAYKRKGGNIIWEWTKLFFGICAIILSIFWLLQFFLVNLPVAIGQPAVVPLVNTFLMAVAPIPFLGPLFYGYGGARHMPAARPAPLSHSRRYVVWECFS